MIETIQTILNFVPLKWTVITLIAMHVVWVYYLALMNLKRARDKGTLTKPAKLMGLPVLLVGGIADWFFNMTFGTIGYLEKPTHWKELFSERCERHMHEDNWRGKQSRFWCRNFLDPYDPDGSHCN